MSPLELKKALVSAGFEVYRTLGDEVLLADRVRDNLIMDSGVRVRAGTTLTIKLAVGVRRGEYPGEADEQLFERARALAAPAEAHGFKESGTAVAPLHDPTDSGRTLDTFFEISFAKDVPSLEASLGDLRAALALAKTAGAR